MGSRPDNERDPGQDRPAAHLHLWVPASGTTLLQRVLNSYQDVLIWGEHVSFLKDVANAYFRVWRNPDFFKSTTPLDEMLRDTKPLTHWQG
jgi:hypothetical protein